ncbi:Triacylglycerol lipase [Bertholletia excelsa]
MATKTSSHVLLLISLCNLPAANNKIRGIFVFGSSLVDNGNNNFLPNSIAKADYLPYGIDFPLGPSGRFSNGKNTIDLLGTYLELPNPFIPPFNSPSTKGSSIVGGVNYASGGSGILDDTGSVAGQVISLNQQIRNFEQVTLPELEAEVGCKSRESLPNYLFAVGSGGNDYSFNYFLRGSNVSLQAFTANLTATLSAQLKKLYDLGARKFVVMAVYPIGCIPAVVARLPAGTGCARDLNMAARLFNSQLRFLVDALRPQLPGSILVFVNSYQIIGDIITNPAPEGFSDVSNPCCEVGSISEGGNGILCKRGGSTCPNRRLHVFFDGLHPTEAVNVVIAANAYASSLADLVYPINLKQLAQI